MNEISDSQLLESLRRQMTKSVARQVAAAGNLANIDTPGYVRQQVNFETELQRMFNRGSNGMAATDARHYTGGNSLRDQLGMDPQQLLESTRMDGNSVDIDQEMITLTETQMRFQAASQALSKKLGTIRTVIQ